MLDEVAPGNCEGELRQALEYAQLAPGGFYGLPGTPIAAEGMYRLTVDGWVLWCGSLSGRVYMERP